MTFYLLRHFWLYFGGILECQTHRQSVILRVPCLILRVLVPAIIYKNRTILTTCQLSGRIIHLGNTVFIIVAAE